MATFFDRVAGAVSNFFDDAQREAPTVIAEIRQEASAFLDDAAREAPRLIDEAREEIPALLDRLAQDAPRFFADTQREITDLLDEGAATDSYAAFLPPANNSGTSAVTFMALNESAGTLTVDVAAKGLTPGQFHPFHIHGFEDGRPSQLPTIAQDLDRDGFVESAEGAAVLGPVVLALTTDTPPAGEAPLEAYPVADAEGRIEFTRTYQFDLDDPDQAELFQALTGNLENYGLQFHGMDVPDGAGAGTPNEVSGGGGYIPAVPVANGLIRDLPDGVYPTLLDFLEVEASDAVNILIA